MSWTRTDQQRRQLDHRLHGHAVHRLDRPDAGHGQRRLSDLNHRHRADQRHRLHVHGQGHQHRRHRPGIDGHRRRSRRTTRSSTSPHRRAANVDSGDGSGVELGVKFTADTQRFDHRHPLLQGGDEHRHPHRQPVDDRRHAARARSPSPNETASGWQTVYFSTPVAITAGTTYIASYYAPNGHYSGTQGGVQQLPSTTRRCTPSRTRRAPTACSPTAPPARSPTPRSTPATTGSMFSSPHHNHAPSTATRLRRPLGATMSALRLCDHRTAAQRLWGVLAPHHTDDEHAGPASRPRSAPEGASIASAQATRRRRARRTRRPPARQRSSCVANPARPCDRVRRRASTTKPVPIAVPKGPNPCVLISTRRGCRPIVGAPITGITEAPLGPDLHPQGQGPAADGDARRRVVSRRELRSIRCARSSS